MQTALTTDCVVIGAGPAGLTAALYLRRFLRSVAVFDHGHSRALAIERSHNYPSFPHGISGGDVLLRLREQLAAVQGGVNAAEVTHVERHPDHGFTTQFGDMTLQSRTVLMATGVVDKVPEIKGIEQLRQHGVLRQCPICDAYEHRGKRIVVLGDGDHAAREAAFIAHYSPHVAHAGLTAVPCPGDPSVRVLPTRAVSAELRESGGDGLHIQLGLADGSVHDFDVAYAALSSRPRSRLAGVLGAAVDAQGSLLVDAHGSTSVNGLFAAGDVVSGLDQMAVAAGQGAIAATAIHNLLLQQRR